MFNTLGYANSGHSLILLHTYHNAKIKDSNNTPNTGKNIQKLDHLYTAVGTVKLYSHSKNSLLVSLKIKCAIIRQLSN